MADYTIEPPADAAPASKYTIDPPAPEASPYKIEPPKKLGLGQALKETGSQLYDLFVDPVVKGAISGGKKATGQDTSGIGKNLTDEELAATMTLGGMKAAPGGKPTMLPKAAETPKAVEAPVAKPETPKTVEAPQPAGAPEAVAKAPVEAAPKEPPPVVQEIPRTVEPLKPMNPIKTIGSTIEKVFSPTTRSADAGSVEGSIRSERGRAERDTETTRRELEQFQSQVGALPQEAKDAFIGYVEGRSKGATLPDPTLQGAADKIKEAVDQRRTKIEKSDWGQDASFVDDYYMHMWKNPPAQVLQAVQGISKQGSGKNLKARTIPTIAEGKAAGLVPVTENPLEMTSLYVQNMDRFIAANNAFDQMKGNGLVKMATPGKQPPGWVELQGRLGSKNTPAGAMKAYAPEDAARVYNNFISRGFDGTDLKDLYNLGRKTSNFMTMMELGLSAFHASTMGMESIISEVAKGVGQVRRGDIVKGAKTAGKGILPWSPINRYKTGLKAEQEYLGTSGSKVPSDLAKVVDLQTEAGGRAIGYDRSQHAMGNTAMGSFFRAWKRGTLGQEMKALPGEFKQAPLGTTAANIARVMETVAEPLFGKLIPRLKNGAFYSQMSDWLEAHPGATKEEQVAQARQAWDSIDNRFGELVMDNVFWNKFLKQASYLMVRSTGWDLGTLREIGGGIKDAARGKPSIRTDYVIALPIVTALYNAAAQYIKTGKLPESATDLYAYQTGGKNPDGSDERAMMPGYMKDVVGYGEHPLKTAGAKVATAPRLVGELLTNSDYRGLPITKGGNVDSTSDFFKTAPMWAKDYAAHVMQAFEPISIKNLVLGNKKGSNIGPAERALGVRPASAETQNPKKIEAIIEKKNNRLWQQKQRSDKRIEGQYEK